MKWTERELQNYRNMVCNNTMQHEDYCESCTKTKEEIIDCYFDLYDDPSDEDEF